MSISNKRHISKHTYCVKGTALETKTIMTYLGVDIDNKLNWTAHCSKVKKKAAQSLGIVQRTLHAAPKACKVTAYTALVRPKLEYATSAWSPQTTGKIKKLESIQRKAARFVCKDYRRETDSGELVKQLNWDTLKTRRDTRDSVMWYKIQHKLVHLPFPTTITPKPRLGRHDHPAAYLQLQPQVNAYKYSFFVRTIPLWNGLPISAINAPTLQSFQRLTLVHMRTWVTLP